MRDKLQEIKVKNQDSLKMISKEPNFYFPNEVMLIEHSSWLIQQLEQALAENLRLKEVDQQGIKCQIEYARQNKLLTEENERLREAEHVKSYWAREGLIEQLKASNQKLVECLEWYADNWNYLRNASDNRIPVKEDIGHRARQTLSEVKGNG